MTFRVKLSFSHASDHQASASTCCSNFFLVLETSFCPVLFGFDGLRFISSFAPSVLCDIWHLPASSVPCFHLSYNHRTIIKSRLEKVFQITKSNHQPDLLSPITKLCPLVPQPRLINASMNGDCSAQPIPML